MARLDLLPGGFLLGGLGVLLVVLASRLREAWAADGLPAAGLGSGRLLARSGKGMAAVGTATVIAGYQAA